MKHEYDYIWSKKDLIEYLSYGDTVSTGSIEGWLCDFDENRLQKSERLNLMLAVISAEIENNCLSDECADELYLYYKDLMSGKLDDVIDDEEREIVVHDLTKCFKKVFPNGLED